MKTLLSLSLALVSLTGLSNLTNLSSAFYNCTGLTGAIPSLTSLSNLTTLSSAFYGCTGLSESSFPTLIGLTKLTDISSAFQSTRLTANTATVADIFGSGPWTNLLTANQCFAVSSTAYKGLAGNAGDFIGLPKSPSFVTNTVSTSGSYRMFYNQTNLGDYATIPAEWK